MPDFLGRLKTPRLAAAPGSPTVGEVYYDTVANQLYFRSNVAWVAAGGSSGALPADTVIAAGTRIIANKFLAGDTQPAFRLWGDGKLEWGPGGTTAPDVQLLRAFAGAIYCLGLFGHQGAAAGNGVMTALVAGDAQFRLVMQANGTLLWGSGAATQDTNLYRSAADTLATDDTFSTPALIAGTVNANSYVRANNGVANNEVVMGYNGSANGPYIIFGTNGSWDTKLYRSAAAKLATDGVFNVGTFIEWNRSAAGAAIMAAAASGDTAYRFTVGNGGTLNWGPGNAAIDTNLYRVSGSNLQTDGSFWVGNSLVVDANNGALGANKIYFGSALDTNLYRAAAGVLKTDGRIEVGATGIKFSDGSIQTKSAQRITGSVSSAGAALAGSGFSVSRTGAGQYDITFTTAFAAAPVVHVTNFAHSNRMATIEPGTLTTTGCRVVWFDTAGAQQDVPFLFTATAIS